MISYQPRTPIIRPLWTDFASWAIRGQLRTILRQPALGKGLPGTVQKTRIIHRKRELSFPTGCALQSAPNAWLALRHHRAAVAFASLAWAASSRLARASTLPEPGRSNAGVCDRGRLPVPHGVPSCGAGHANQCTPLPTRPSASLSWATSSWSAYASALRSLERHNTGMGDDNGPYTVHQEVCPMGGGLGVYTP